MARVGTVSLDYYTSLYSQSLRGNPRPLNTVRNLFKSDVPRIIRALDVLWLAVDAKRAETAVIRGTKLGDGDVLRCLAQLIRNLLWGLHSRIQRVRDANEGNLFHAISIPANTLSDFLPDCGLVLFGRKLNQEVP